MRQHHDREYAGLKTAFRVVIQHVGGLEAARAVTGYPTSRLAAAYDLAQLDRMPRCDHVADLEAVAGTPLVTFHLARLSGHTLLPLGDAAGLEGKALAAVLGAAGELGQRAMEAMADGRLDEAERARLLDQLGTLQRGVAQAMAVLAGAAPAPPLRRVA